MIDHAREACPTEACGVVTRKAGAPARVRRLRNIHETPTKRYNVALSELRQLERELACNGEELFAIYHSHPRTEAYPSATDVRLAAWPDAVYLIISVKDPAEPELRAFLIDQSGRPEDRRYDVPLSESLRRQYRSRVAELQVVIV